MSKYIGTTPIVKYELEAGTYNITLFKFGYAIHEIYDVKITEGDTLDLGTITMEVVEMKKIGTIEVISGVYDICDYCTEVDDLTHGFVVGHVLITKYVYIGMTGLAETTYNNLPSADKPSDYPKSITYNEMLGVTYYYLGLYKQGNNYTGCDL